ncbi:MAG: ABC transporter permease [Saprospiraceae bacterium]|nr:ABC transporter permease [Saprospiraceae bacterium]
MTLPSFRIAVRRLTRQKLGTTLHVMGLTLGLSVCLLIGLYLHHELSYDTYHTHAERIYRVNQTWIFSGERHDHFSTPVPLADAIRDEFPEFEAVSHVHPDYDALIEVGPKRKFIQDHVLFADADFLNLFDVHMIEGNGFTVLNTPNQVILTRSVAEKFYGKEDPIGKTFKLKDKLDLTVGGVAEDFPANTHLPASMLISFSSLTSEYYGAPLTQWGMVSGGETLVMLPPGEDAAGLQPRLQSIYDRNLNNDPNLPAGETCELSLQPLLKVHFEEQYRGGGEWVKAINPKWLWFFGSIGLGVLALACINFINLSTAQALQRAKEVGIRKSVGAGKSQLLLAFLQEALLLSGLSGILAYLLVQLSLPQINRLMNEEISTTLLQSPGLIIGLLAGVLLTSLVAGLYPAWVISGFHPAQSIKAGWKSVDRHSVWLRKGLVVAQFTLSVGLLTSLLFMRQQVRFLRTMDLGFVKDNVLLTEIPDKDKIAQFAHALSGMPGVQDVAFSTTPPTNDGHWGTVMSLTDGEDPNRKDVTVIMADEHYAPLYGMRLLAGRLIQAGDSSFVSPKLPVEDQIPKVVVNESLINALGFSSPEAALGQRFWFGFNGWRPEIVGVVHDFNTLSLHKAIKPTLLCNIPTTFREASIKLTPAGDVSKTMVAIRHAWEDLFPEDLFSMKFLDENINSFYESEQRLFSLFEFFSLIALFISCLGLWGLATFAAQQRTKEIGIRKVLGASVSGLVGLMSGDFLKLVAISLILAAPLSYFFMQRWLQHFAYRIELHWYVFAGAGIVALTVAFLTVSFQSIKTAFNNPTKSLRSE